MRDIDAEPVHSPVEPEAHHVVDGATDVLVPPVEVWLLGQEVMQVVLAAGFIERPGRTLLRRPEDGAPVVRRTAAARVGPHVPVPLRVLA